MDKFAFVIHTTDLNLFSLAIDEPNLTKKRKQLIEQVFTWLPPLNISHITGIRSITGKEIEGYFIYCTLLPEQLLNLNQQFVLKKIVEGGKIAQDLGAKIIGLGAYAANVGRKGILVEKNLKIPVTTGTTYTVVVTVEATLKAMNEVGMELKKARVAIIGASGGIGSTIAQILADKITDITLVARNQNRLNNLANLISRVNNKVKLQITDNIKKAVSSANVVFVSTTSPSTLIDSEDINPGTIICDISQPRNVSPEVADKRSDVLVIDGGIVKVPGDVNFNFYFGLPPKLAYACIAETMILTLEGLFESYSIGGNISLEKTEKIAKLAKKHGFQLSTIRSFGKNVRTEQFDKLREIIRLREKL